ncbi:MAG: hypothetical protein U1F24_00195 [Alphaproteobacteria bacterium]
MSGPTDRSWRITRRTLGLAALAALGGTAAGTWPRWAFWRTALGASLAALAGLPQAAALKALGARIAAGEGREALAARLEASLAPDGYDAAVARDRAAGRFVVVDGWRVPETTALAAMWLASADRTG